MKKNFTLNALIVLAMIMSASLVNNVSAQKIKRPFALGKIMIPSATAAVEPCQTTSPAIDPFAVLAGSTVTNTGNSIVTGDLGVSPGTSVTGFPPGTVTGTIHLGDAAAIAAQGDVTTCFNEITALVCDVDLTGQDLGGMTLAQGMVYCFLGTSAQLTGQLTLDAQSNVAPFWVFKIGNTLTTASGSSVVLINSLNPTSEQPAFWHVGSSATLGTTTSFVGAIVAQESITLNNGASLFGRALARTGAVTLDTNNVKLNNTPTAALVNVGGRVTTTSGRGIYRALIKMTNSAGEVRTAFTNPFGYYNFANVPVGQTLIFEPRAKRYSFTEPMKVVSFNEESTSVDFIGF